MPHDAKVREVGAPGARTRIETLFTSIRWSNSAILSSSIFDRSGAPSGSAKNDAGAAQPAVVLALAQARGMIRQRGRREWGRASSGARAGCGS
jgi:hypothetical protein